MTTCILGSTGIEEIGSVADDAKNLWSKFTEDRSITKYQKAIADASKTPATMNNPTDPVVKYTFDQANKVIDALSAAGVPDPGRSYAVYQTYHETQAYTNNGVKQYNNYSGIKFAGQKGAKKGPNGYAVFDTMADWANAFKHEITKGANPAAATSLEDYAARLKKNGYYDDTLQNYIAGPNNEWLPDPEAGYRESISGLKAARLVLKDLPATDRATTQSDGTTQNVQDKDIPGTKTDPGAKIKKWWQGLETWEQIGIGSGVVLVVVILIKN